MATEHLIIRHTITLLLDGTDSTQSLRYARLPFTVPTGMTALRIVLSRDTKEPAQLPVALFDATKNIRIMKASEGLVGPTQEEYLIGFDTATEGAIPGPIPSGEWLLILYKRRFVEDITLTIEITATDIPSSGSIHPPKRAPFSEAVLNSKPGWYAGELHMHSLESTGRTSVADVLSVAQKEKLDFIALTDHFAASHWLQIQKIYDQYNLLCLQSMEISGDYGHANVHGISSWINPLVDDNVELAKSLGLASPPSMESIADETHRQGGLFCINHALSGLVAWRYHDFPMEKADLFEIWCVPDGPTTFLYPTLWDNYLCQGLRLTGVGSSDSHNPSSDGPWQLGKIRNWVEAEELSRKGVLSALKAGRCYVSYGQARLDYTASYKGEHYAMGETIKLEPEQECTFTVNISDAPSGNLFIMMSGQVHDVIYCEASEGTTAITHTFKLQDKHLKRIPNGEAFIRIEFHEDVVKARFWGMAHRDHTTMRLLSNPIWIAPQKL